MFLFKHYYVNEKLLKFDYTIFFGFFFSESHFQY